MMKLRFSPLHITNPKLLKMKIGKKIYLGLKIQQILKQFNKQFHQRGRSQSTSRTFL